MLIYIPNTNSYLRNIYQTVNRGSNESVLMFGRRFLTLTFLSIYLVNLFLMGHVLLLQFMKIHYLIINILLLARRVFWKQVAFEGFF